MKHVLFFYETAEESARRADPAQAQAYWGAWTAYIGAMSAAGVMVGGEGLEAPATAATLRLQGGVRRVQDGPFADAKEQLGGFIAIDVPDMETALDWAARAPCAAAGGVEVRRPLPPMPPA